MKKRLLIELLLLFLVALLILNSCNNKQDNDPQDKLSNGVDTLQKGDIMQIGYNGIDIEFYNKYDFISIKYKDDSTRFIINSDNIENFQKSIEDAWVKFDKDISYDDVEKNLGSFTSNGMIIDGVIDTTIKEQILYQLRRYNFDTGYLKVFSIESNNGRILMDYDFSNSDENQLELVIDNFKDTTIYVKYIDTTKSLIDTTIQNNIDTIPHKDSLIPKTIIDYNYTLRYRSSDKKKTINKLYKVLNCDYIRYH